MEPALQTRHCKACNEDLPLANFAVRGGARGSSPQSRCRECQRKYAAGWYKKPENAAKIRQQGATWWKAHPVEAKLKARKQLCRKYGITIDMFEKMLSEQHGRCAICFGSEPGGNGSFYIDHCHATNQVRGLLCHYCNFLLGQAFDSPTVLASAIAYLQKYQKGKG
jgi:hypothetical protein